MPLCGFNSEMIDGLRRFGGGLHEEGKMTFCGFNDDMKKGLNQFGTGLGGQALKRASDDDVTLRASFDSELSEMRQMLEGLQPDTPKKEALLGCLHLARALYRAGQGLDEPMEAYARNLEETIAFFVELDRLYYDELRPGRSQEEAVELLLERIEQM